MKKNKRLEKKNNKISEIFERFKEKKIEKKPKKENKKQDKSIDDIVKKKRTKKQTKSFSYFGGFGTTSNINYNEFNSYDTSKLDYNKLYSYLGSGVKKGFKESYEIRNPASDELGEKEILSSEQVDTILKKTVMSQMMKSSLDNISIEEKEKFNWYKQCNRVLVMVKYDLLGLGYHS